MQQIQVGSITEKVPQLFFHTVSREVIYNKLFAPIQRNIKYEIKEPISIFILSKIIQENSQLKWKK